MCTYNTRCLNEGKCIKSYKKREFEAYKDTLLSEINTLVSEIDTFVSDLKPFKFDELELEGSNKNYKYNRLSGAKYLSVDPLDLTVTITLS